jgi:hypothetical protein
MKAVNIGLAFVLELALLAALGYWGSRLGASVPVRWLAAVGAVVAVALLWSQIAAPNAKRRLAAAPLVVFKLVVFTLGSALLYRTGQHGLGFALEAVAVTNLGLATAWQQV